MLHIILLGSAYYFTLSSPAPTHAPTLTPTKLPSNNPTKITLSLVPTIDTINSILPSTSPAMISNNRPTNIPTEATIYDNLNSNTFIDFRINVSQYEWIFLLISVIFGMCSGLLLWKIRSDITYVNKIIEFILLKCIVIFVLYCTSIEINIVTVIHIMTQFDQKEIILAGILLLCFSYYAILSIIFQFRLIFPSCDIMGIGDFLNGTILYEQAFTFAFVSFLSLIGGPLILIFLPWRMSEFCQRSGGIPNLRTFRIVMYSEIIVAVVRFVVVAISREKSTISRIAIFISFIQFWLSSLHTFIKLRAISIQQYDAEITLKSDNNMNTVSVNIKDIESLLDGGNILINKNSNEKHITSVSTSQISMQELTFDVERYVNELDSIRRTIEDLRISNRESIKKRDSSTSISSNNNTLLKDLDFSNIVAIADKSHVAKVAHIQMNILKCYRINYVL
jgi:hypothetical protein